MGIAIFWMQVGWAARQRRNIGDVRSAEAELKNGGHVVSGTEGFNADSATDSAKNDEELKRRYEEDMKAFSDTMNYSVEQAYGIGKT